MDIAFLLCLQNPAELTVVVKDERLLRMSKDDKREFRMFEGGC